MRSCLGLVALFSVLGAVTGSPTANAAYPGDDGLIAFTRGSQIYTVAPEGGAASQLTTDGFNSYPKWSPDGSHIAFVQKDAAGQSDIYVMTADGAALSRVTTLGQVTTNPSWSPDGTTIAFGAGEPCPILPSDCSRQLYTVAAAAPFGSPVAMSGWSNDLYSGPDPENVTGVLVDRYLAWAPDGSKIGLFNHISPVWDDSLSEYYLATGEVREIVGTGAACCGFADWSDLAYGVTGAFGYSEVDHGSNFQYDPRPRVRIVYPGFLSRQGDQSPAPSPSDTQMAFVNTKSGKARILVSTISGDERRTLVRNAGQPDWQPTG